LIDGEPKASEMEAQLRDNRNLLFVSEIKIGKLSLELYRGTSGSNLEPDVP